MHDVEIERLVLHLPGVPRERAQAIAEQVGKRLLSHLAYEGWTQTGRFEQLWVVLDARVGETDGGFLERMTEAVASGIQEA